MLTEYKTGWISEPLCIFEDEKDPFSLPGIEARFIGSLAQSLVTTPIALPRLLKASIQQECI